ncbi:ErmE/ErmH/ErmO/ErmR family 23S rRNA (adenine(2058)-N(6))-methyltransferase [Streptomyces humicola]|uniref:ErmE/ErmH/ErmO/ErmR family 23S rRNA (adenine(2058)-N(6))-methyltransferase n=1 Tax=Streptomyces humicola TaxID=2953240 RepID=UPI0022B27B6B
MRDQRRRSFSQNFIKDRTAIDRIVRTARIDPAGLVVEIGAGDGRLTAALAARAACVVAHEIDPFMAARLRARCRDLPNVRCVVGDFLNSTPPRQPFAVAACIPYAVTSPIVNWCLNAPGLTSATLVTQWEYARKRTGDFGSWSRVTVESWPRFDWRLAGRIDRGAFRPVPRVDSGILRLTHRGNGLLPAAVLPRYRQFVEVGFSGVGGTLHASLRREFPRARVDAAFGAAGMVRGTVVGFVHPDQWITLFRHILEMPERV